MSRAPGSAREVHARAIVVNGLAGGKDAVPAVLGDDSSLPELMRTGGVTAANVTVAVSDGFTVTVAKLARLLDAVERSEGRIRVARTRADIERAKRDDAVALVLGLQDSEPLEGSAEHLDVLVRLGLRVLQLTYQRRNRAADGCGEPADGGLSVYGRSLITQLNERGVLLDLSHAGARSAREAIDHSGTPVVISHTAAHALNPHPRNVTDDLIRALADRGGVVGIAAVARLVSREGTERGARMDELVDHVEHVSNLVGIDHVGLGLDVSEGMTPADFEVRRRTFLARFPELGGGDFSFEHYYVEGLASMAQLPRVTEALLERGFSEVDVAKVLGGNLLRVFGEVWGPD